MIDHRGVVINERVSTRWYAAGLHFECRGCGGCCSGPGEGYIWVARPEVQMIAAHLNLTPEELCHRYMRHVGLRLSIVEEPITKDCIFLQMIDGFKQCAIYSVRPGQCRTWPFWSENLASPEAWNRAAQRCPGINRGRLYSCDEIEKIRKNTRWWDYPKDIADSSRK
ncbi:MAG TPA: YkgJ family cysteine cluster protein [Sedimentisphaerales bacterium]|nr:YkgJ family cysteine cluster protein [Sedimentisphaerales bacterium]HNU30819.1 YkgJ family cysteine cluster protein [Sedimentisphaerales bacterium]